MAITTRNQSASMLGFALGRPLLFPLPDGDIEQPDSMNLVARYAAEVPYPAPTSKQIILFRESGAGWATGGTSWMSIRAQTGSASEGGSAAVWAADGVFRNWRIRLESPPGVGKSVTFTLRTGTGLYSSSNTDTPLFVTISGTNTEGTYVGADVPISAGDWVSIRVDPSGSPTGSALRMSLEFEADIGGQSSYSGWQGGGFAFGNTAYSAALAPNVRTSALSAMSQDIVPTFGAITHLYIRLENVPTIGAESVTFNLVRNGVVQDGTSGSVNTTIVCTGSAGYFDLPFSLTVVPGDLVSIRGVCSNPGPGSTFFECGVQFTADILGESILSGHADAFSPAQNGGSSYYALPSDWAGAGLGFGLWSLTEAPRQLDAAVTPFALCKLYVRLDPTAPGSGNGYQFRMRVNGAYPTDTLDVTIQNNVFTGNDTTHTVSAVDGDLLSLEHHATGSPTGTRYAHWNMVQLIGVELPPTNPLVGINPEQGDPTGDVYFAMLRLGVEHYFAADTLIRDDADHYEGKKAATLISVSPVERELARDGYRGSTFSVVVNDTPDPVSGERLWRGLWNTRTIEQMLIEVYRCSAPYGRIVGEPFRVCSGVVKAGGFRTKKNFTFEFDCIDLFGDRFANPRNQPQIPTFRLIVNDVPNIVEGSKGKYCPRVIGYALEPGVGVVPMLPLIENVNLQDLFGIGAVDVDVDVWLLSEGYVFDIPQAYYNLMVWGSESEVLAGDLIRPTPDNQNDHVYRAQNGGTTDTTEPTWPTGTGATVGDNGITWEEAGPDDLYARFPVPPTAYSDLLTHPHAPNWLTATGLTVDYVDYSLEVSGPRRFTPVFTAHNHRFGKALREGRMTILFDVVGSTENPNSGPPILKFTQAIMRMLLDYIFTPTNLVTYGDIPIYGALTGPYTIFDTDSADRAEEIGDSLGGLIVGFVLGANGEQRGLWDWIAAMLKGGFLRIGPNRHNQIMFARKDPAAVPTITFRGDRYIIDAEYVTDGDRRVNQLFFRYGERYADPFGGIPTPEEGSPLPENDTDKGWQSGLLELRNQDAIDALWETHAAILPPENFDNEVTRDVATAIAVASEILDYGTGPAPSYHGTTLFTITGPWELLTKLDSNGKTRELGDTIAIIDEEGPSDDGETVFRCWITKIRLDPEQDQVTLSGEILPD